MIFVFLWLTYFTQYDKSLSPSTLLQMALFLSFLWQSSIPLYIYTTPSLSIHLLMDTQLASIILSFQQLHFIPFSGQCGFIIKIQRVTLLDNWPYFLLFIRCGLQINYSKTKVIFNISSCTYFLANSHHIVILNLQIHSSRVVYLKKHTEKYRPRVGTV